MFSKKKFWNTLLISLQQVQHAITTPKGLFETHAEYVDNVLFDYIKDWMKLLIEEDRFEEAKEMFSIYSAVMATRPLN